MEARREFLKKAAYATVGSTLFGTLAPGCAAPSDDAETSGASPSDDRDRLGYALVGLGSLSANQLAPALERSRHCRLAGIVTGSPDKAREWQQRYGLPDRSVYDYADIERMADDPAIDVVYVVTPNAQHAEQTIAAARAGKHVLCEKPMEVSVEKCEAMIAACAEHDRQLAIAYRCRFEPHHLECVRLAREGVLGDLRMIEAGFGFRIGNPDQWRLDRELAGGGPLMDVGIYALQTTRMLTGEEPVRVTAVARTTDPVKFDEVEESIAWDLEFPGGVVASCAATYGANGLNAFTAYCTGGSFGMRPAYNYGGNRGWRSDGAPLQFEPIDQFAAEMDDFAECIRTGTPSRVRGEEGLQDVRILMAIYEAARTGRAVEL